MNWSSSYKRPNRRSTHILARQTVDETFKCLSSWTALGGLQTLTPYLSPGGDGASPAAGGEAGRAGAGGG